MLSRKKFIILVFSLIVVLFSGCMPEAKPYKPSKIDPNKALIYVYRVESFLQRGVGWTIKVNGEVKRKYFINNSYVPIYVQPGDITVEITQYTYPYSTYDKVVLHDVKAGNIYYVKAIPGAFAANTLKVVDANTAEKEIPQTSFYEDVKD